MASGRPQEVERLAILAASTWIHLWRSTSLWLHWLVSLSANSWSIRLWASSLSSSTGWSCSWNRRSVSSSLRLSCYGSHLSLPQSNPKSTQRPRLHRWQHHSRAWTWFNMGQWSAVLLSLLPECWVSDWPALVLASCQLRLSSISSSTLVNPKRVSHSWRAA